MPPSQRFNRGNMGMEELVQRVLSSGAKAALIVTLHKGNPGVLRVIYPDGSERVRLKIESAALRREVLPRRKIRIERINSLTIPPAASLQTSRLADQLGEILDVPVEEIHHLQSMGPDGRGAVDIRLTDLYGGRTLWTHHYAEDGVEIGPRIRIAAARWNYDGG